MIEAVRGAVNRYGAISFSLLLLLAAAFWSYSPGLGGGFILDDSSNIRETATDSLAWDDLKDRIFWGVRLGSYSRSLTRLSFALTQYFSGYDAYTFKYQNLLIHLINGLLVFWLMSLLAGSRDPQTEKKALWFALAVTAVWLLHPLQVSTVLYAVQRLVLLSALFTLAALICYVKGRLVIDQNPVKGALLAIGGVALFGALGLLSKENAALLPLYIALIELFFLRAPDSSNGRRAAVLLRGALVLVPLLAAAAYALLRFDALTMDYAGREFTLQERLATQVHILALYLKLFFIPIPGGMSLFHDNFPVRHAVDPQTLLLSTFYAGLLVLGVWLRRRQPAIGFGILWFFACHALESTFLPLELVFEHRNYLAILGLGMVVVRLVMLAFSSANTRKLIAPTLVGIILLLGLNTAARSFVWADTELMVKTEYAVRPDSARVLSTIMYFEMKRGNQAAVDRYMDELLALDRPTASADLLRVALHCKDDQLPEDVYAQALSKLQTGVISATTINALRNLVSSYVNASCTAITSDQIHALTDAAIRNHRKAAVYRCATAYTRTLLYMHENDWTRVKESLDDMLEQCTRQSPLRYRQAVASLINFAKARGLVEEMLGVLNKVSDQHGRAILKAYGKESGA
jgi:hypothetical protein